MLTNKNLTNSLNLEPAKIKESLQPHFKPSLLFTHVFFAWTKNEDKFGKLSGVVSCAGGQTMGCGLTVPWYHVESGEENGIPTTSWEGVFFRGVGKIINFDRDIIFFEGCSEGFVGFWHELMIFSLSLCEDLMVRFYINIIHLWFHKLILILQYVFLCKTRWKTAWWFCPWKFWVTTKPSLRWTKKAIHINWNLSWRLEGREGGGGFDILWNFVKLSHDGFMGICNLYICRLIYHKIVG